MKFVFAPDSFKGSLSAREIIELLTETAERLIPGCECVGIPMADGGEGTMDIIKDICNGQTIPVQVCDPLFQTIPSHFAVLNGDTALIEMAAASGLPLVPADKRNPELTTTLGTGQLIKAALDLGYRKFIIGVGGSATNDGGTGALSALGVRFLDEKGKNLSPIGKNLIHIRSIDLSHLHSDARCSSFQVMCDIDNPLLGERGASYVFAPQKGASPRQCEMLEQGMRNYNEVLSRTLEKDVSNIPGAGAAGGLAAGLMALLGASLSSGIRTVLSLSHFEEIVKDADYCITGEGRADSQSAHGKVLWGVGQSCSKYSIPVLAVTGCLGDGYEELYSCGIQKIYPSIEDGMTVEYAMAHAKGQLRKAAERMFRDILRSKSGDPE